MKGDYRNQMSFDEILEQVVGGAGRWQWCTLITTLPMMMAGPVPLLLHLFTAYTPAHRCMVPACENPDNTSINQPWLDIAIPKDYDDDNFLTEKMSYNPCAKYNNFNPSGSCSADNFDRTNHTECMNGYIYDHSDFSETIATKLNLVCGDQSHNKFLGTILMLGLLIGSIIGGVVADRYGRRMSMLLALILICPSLIIGAFSPNYEAYITLRFINCVGFPIVWLSIHSTILEMFSDQYKWLVASIENMLGVLSFLTLALLAFLFRDWSTLHIACGIFCSVASICWIWMPESIRWLAQNNKLERAQSNLRIMAKGNGKILQEEEIKKIEAMLEEIHVHSIVKEEKQLNPIDMLRHGYLRATLIQLLCWITINVGNYTLLLNATKLSGNVILNFTYTALSELPAVGFMSLTLKLFSRRANLAMYMGLVGVCCFTLAFTPKSQNVLILLVFLCGKSFIGAAFVIIWLVTSELYPTNLRTQAVGICSTVARIFGLICPFVSNLAVYWKPLPMVLLGTPSFLSAFLTLMYLPETKDKALPQNLVDARKFKFTPGEGDEEEMQILRK